MWLGIEKQRFYSGFSLGFMVYLGFIWVYGGFIVTYSSSIGSFKVFYYWGIQTIFDVQRFTYWRHLGLGR